MHRPSPTTEALGPLMGIFHVISFAALAAALGFSARASGQTREVWLEPRVGVVLATTDLGRTDVLGGSGFGAFESADPAPALGIGARIGFGTHGSVRFSADWSPKTDVAGTWKCAPFVACPAVLLPLRGQLSRGSASVDAGLGLRSNRLSPMVYAGIGLRWSEVDWGPPAADVTLPVFSFAERDPVYRLGAGVEQAIHAVTVFLEVGGVASRFGGHAFESIEGGLEEDRPLIWDVGLSGGVRIRLY